MIRILIVDDEKIVRKGLISSMPWEQFGMEVVGEANNGLNALEFLDTNKVDMLFTDLAMPMMSGIELMREVRMRHPHIQIVVLTLHQDFEYVQEALRLGAIDYIVKTQLEKERFEDMLGRIVSYMEQRDSFKGSPAHQDEIGQVDEISALYSLRALNDDEIMDMRLPRGAVEIEAGTWCWSKTLPESFTPNVGFVLVLFQDLKGLSRKSVLQLLRAYRKYDLFYDYDPNMPALIVRSKEDGDLGKAQSGHEADVNSIKEKWLTSEWIYNDSHFEEMLHGLKSLRLPSIRLTRIFFTLVDEWNRLYRQILPNPIMLEDFIPSWAQFTDWLRDERDKIRLANIKPLYSEEIRNGIVRAMNLAQRHMHQSMTAGEVAQMIHMSSSYFSQCFKDITGQTYTDYVRELRMERAKEYLSNTTKSISWIAEHIGYNDEKYFSRLFKDQIGMLPSEYRIQTRNDDSNTN